MNMLKNHLNLFLHIQMYYLISLLGCVMFLFIKFLSPKYPQELKSQAEKQLAIS